MEYRSAIVNELGELVAWCSDLSYEDKERLLDEHPEYSYMSIGCDFDGYPYYE